MRVMMMMNRKNTLLHQMMMKYQMKICHQVRGLMKIQSVSHQTEKAFLKNLRAKRILFKSDMMQKRQILKSIKSQEVGKYCTLSNTNILIPRWGKLGAGVNSLSNL
jgi:hypothetical protein